MKLNTKNKKSKYKLYQTTKQTESIVNNKKIFHLLISTCIISFEIMSCNQYSQTTDSSYNSDYRTDSTNAFEYRVDTIYNPPNLPGVEMLIIRSGGAYPSSSGVIRDKKPLTPSELDSLNKRNAEIRQRIELRQKIKRDTLQSNDTIKNTF